MAALGEATETPERLWTAAMRANTAEEVAHLALQAHAAQVSPHVSLCSSFLDVSQVFSVMLFLVARSAVLLACFAQSQLLLWLYTCAMSYW